MEKWRKDWVKKKTNIALRLDGGECGGSYEESMIILCAVLSSLAADIWPGEKKDRARFIELLKEFSPKEFQVTKISIPLLFAYLKNRISDEDHEIFQKAFLDYDSTLVLTGDDIDKSETEIMMLFNTLDLKVLRDHSCASLLYTEVRSGYVHEYKTGKLTDAWPMTQKQALVSYVNWACKPDRHIHFHIGQIAEIALSIAEEVDNIENTLPRNDPENWWIHGKI